MVVDRSSERMHAALEDGALAVEADASREDVLKRVGIERARGLVAVVGTDAENVYAVLSARVLRPDLFIVSRAETEDATAKLKRAGADRVILPYQIGAAQIAQTALRPAVVDFVELATGTDNLELSMEEIEIAKGSALMDRTLLEANLRQRFGVIVVGIQRADGRMEFNPPPETRSAGTKLVVLGAPRRSSSLEEEASLTGARVLTRRRRQRDSGRADRAWTRSQRGRAGSPHWASCWSSGDPASEIYVNAS